MMKLQQPQTPCGQYFHHTIKPSGSNASIVEKLATRSPTQVHKLDTIGLAPPKLKRSGSSTSIVEKLGRRGV